MNQLHQELRLRYKVAYETYEGLVSRNHDTFQNGGTPTAEELAEERQALTRLAGASRAMQEALLSSARRLDE